MQARRVTSHLCFDHDRDFLSSSLSLTYSCGLCLPNWSCWIINGHPYFCTHRWHFDLLFSSNRESSVAHTIGIWALQMCSLRLIKNKRCRSETEPGHTIKEKHLDKLWYLQWWNQDRERGACLSCTGLWKIHCWVVALFIFVIVYNLPVLDYLNS